MSSNYVSADFLRQSAEADEASSSDHWERLAETVSRMFDRHCEVSDAAFGCAGDTATERIFRTNGTEYLQLPPYVADSITAISVGEVELALNDESFVEVGNFLEFGRIPYKNKPVSITARWGMAAVPADITHACMEQALFMWRRKDLAFSEIAGVSAAAVAAEYSPTFIAVSQRYREKYSLNGYFA